MASNAVWCKPVSEWRHELLTAAREGHPEQLLRLSILMDAYPVAGNEHWFMAVQAQLRVWSGSGERWLSDMALAALQFDTPLTLFGGFKHLANAWTSSVEGFSRSFMGPEYSPCETV